MDRINDPSAPNRRWVAKDPNVVGSGTIIKKEWLQGIDDELANAIEASGQLLNPEDAYQLTKAIAKTGSNAIEKSPFYRITPNQRLLNFNSGFVEGWEVYGLASASDVIVVDTVQTGVAYASRHAETRALFDAMGIPNNNVYISHNFNVLKLKFGIGTCVGVHFPITQMLTVGAWVKLLSGSISGGWATGAIQNQWKLCGLNIGHSKNMNYIGCHPYATTPVELLIALPAVVTGYVNLGINRWSVFPYIGEGKNQEGF